MDIFSFQTYLVCSTIEELYVCITTSASSPKNGCDVVLYIWRNRLPLVIIQLFLGSFSKLHRRGIRTAAQHFRRIEIFLCVWNRDDLPKKIGVRRAGQ